MTVSPITSKASNNHKIRIKQFPGVSLGHSSFGCRGLFSAKAFSEGEIILREFAVCWQDEGVPLNNCYYSPQNTAEDVMEVLLQMAPFCGIPPAHDVTRKELVTSTMKANSWGCSGSVRGLFPILCLSNASCDPSAIAEEERREEEETGPPVYVLRARRAILAGEEITVSYCPRAWRKSKRKKELLENWGFDCNCDRCSRPYDDTLVYKCKSCDTGLIFAPDTPNSTSPCQSCGAMLLVCNSDEENFDDLLAVEEGWTLDQCRNFASTLINHPKLALDDVRCFTSLSGLFWAVSEFSEGVDLRDALLGEIVKVAMRSRFVCLRDLGIEVE